MTGPPSDALPLMMHTLPRRLASTVTFCVLFSIQAHTISAAPKDEFEVRALVLFRVLQYSDWNTPLGETLELCTAGTGKSHHAIEQHLNSRKLTPKTNINVTPLTEKSTPAIAQSCEVLIVGPNSNKNIYADFENTFVICNDCQHHSEFAAINLFRYRDKVRFSIDRQIASRNGVRFHSDVLKVAVPARHAK